ncbi:MAG: glycosyltransferase [Acidobacteria bacterium]|nr:glycosyltransferase [Acidobacteriota bacterium]
MTTPFARRSPDAAPEPARLKVAIIHDWLTVRRGGEKVLQSICRLYPGADVFTLFHMPARIGDLVAGHRVTASWLNRLPGAARFYRFLLPLMPAAIESFDLRGYGLVISSSHAVAKGAAIPAGIPHVCYCHTPMRYLWDVAGDYFAVGRFPRLRKAMLAAWKNHLRAWDLRSNARITRFVANSENVRRRIRQLYGRGSAVIHPPVDVDFFTPAPAQPAGDYFLIVSALEPYKRVELAIRVLDRLKKRLVVVGHGSQAGALRRLAGPRVEFAGWVSDESLRELYRSCRAVLFPGIEDFGIVPVEAQACGKPVLAYACGGALETVLPGRTGLLFAEQTEESLQAAVRGLDDFPFDANAARTNSLRFSRPRFESAFLGFMTNFLAAPDNGGRVEDTVAGAGMASGGSHEPALSNEQPGSN